MINQMSKQTLSIVINTKNSQTTIVRTLQSVRQVADEIVVVDMQSSDQTVELAKRYTDRIFSYPDVGYVEPARNFAVSKAKSDWILVIDADEEISTGLRNFLFELKENKLPDHLKADCYFLPRQNVIFGKWIEKTGWWPDFQLRLFASGRVEWLEQIHSIPMTTGKTIELPARDQYALIHHNYQTVDQFVDRLNRYTHIEANQGGKVTSPQILNDYLEEMLRRLFAQKGIDEGIHGLALSLLQSNYPLLSGLKKWQNNGFKPSKGEQLQVIKTLKKFQSDLNYWIADWHVRHSHGAIKIGWKLRRKFKI